MELHSGRVIESRTSSTTGSGGLRVIRPCCCTHARIANPRHTMEGWPTSMPTMGVGIGLKCSWGRRCAFFASGVLFISHFTAVHVLWCTCWPFGVHEHKHEGWSDESKDTPCTALRQPNPKCRRAATYLLFALAKQRVCESHFAQIHGTLNAVAREQALARRVQYNKAGQSEQPSQWRLGL